jgi:hypothetical protein
MQLSQTRLLSPRPQYPGAYARKTKPPEELSLLTDQSCLLRIKDMVRPQKLLGRHVRTETLHLITEDTEQHEHNERHHQIDN